MGKTGKDILMILGSPKNQVGASGKLLKALCAKLPAGSPILNYQSDQEEIVTCFSSCQAIVLAFPLYVDGIPGHFLEFLEDMEGRIRGSGIRIYAIINCGFYEAIQCESALNMAKHWAEAAGMDWGMGLSIGAGGMIGSIPGMKGPLSPLDQALGQLAGCIENGLAGADLFIEPKFPRRLYVAAAHRGWHRQITAAGRHRREIRNKPF